MKKEDASIAELIKDIKLGGLLLPEFRRRQGIGGLHYAPLGDEVIVLEAAG